MNQKGNAARRKYHLSRLTNGFIHNLLSLTAYFHDIHALGHTAQVKLGLARVGRHRAYSLAAHIVDGHRATLSARHPKDAVLHRDEWL